MPPDQAASLPSPNPLRSATDNTNDVREIQEIWDQLSIVLA
jgi:hypothetical protein